MNWQTELNNSFSWLMGALVFLLVGLFIALSFLRKTKFGKQFWRVVQPAWAVSHKGKTLGLIILLLLFVLLEVRISVLNTYFYNGLYKSLQDKAVDAFWFFAGINALLVLVKITHSIVNYLITQAFEIKWLEKLNAEMLNRWLDNKNYYLLR